MQTSLQALVRPKSTKEIDKPAKKKGDDADIYACKKGFSIEIIIGRNENPKGLKQ